jgi:hypothetical protein
MRYVLNITILMLAIAAPLSYAEDVLIETAHYPNAEPIPYILNANNATPKYVIILFPGGDGRVDPHREEGQLVYALKGNFLLRARKHMVDAEFATVTTNASPSEERIQGVISDITQRFPQAQIYLMGTSNGTFATMSLAGYLADKIAGVIHTSSLSRIYSFNAKEYKNRQLVVHHKEDGCHATLFDSAQGAHEKYGNEFIVMQGGISVGDPCMARGHHGYNGIESETVTAIKQWIKQGDKK